LKTPNLRYAASLLLAGLLSCGTTASNPPKLAAGVQPDRKPVENASPPANESALAIVNASDRSEADKKLDPGRHPAELLSFFRIGPGMRVAEIGAAGLHDRAPRARRRGERPSLRQNSKGLLERFAEKPWSERLAKPVMKNVVRVDREFEDPLPPRRKTSTPWSAFFSTMTSIGSESTSTR